MRKLILSLCCFILLSACGPSPEQQAAMTSTALTATAAAWTPTLTATLTPMPTDTPTPTLTPTPTDTPTPTLSPTPTHDPNRFYAPDDSFSIDIPPGWDTQDFNLKYLGLIGPRIGNGNPSLVFVTEENSYSLLMYTTAFLNSVKVAAPDLTTVSEETLLTPDDREYVRMVVVYTLAEVSIQQVYYFFDFDGTKFTAVFSRTNLEGAELDPMIDEIIGTLRFGP
jgi:hypothetical protein